MVSFMRKRGYSFEAHYIDAILNWRQSRFNYQMLNYLLDELMPWHKDCYDFSTLEVNRYIYTYAVSACNDIMCTRLKYALLFLGVLVVLEG